MKKILVLFMLLLKSVYAQSINDTLNEQTFLIEQIKQDFLSINMTIENLKIMNENLSTENKTIKDLCSQSADKILKLEDNINSLKTALNSNKEDENIIIKELGNMYQRLQNYKEYLYSVEHKLNNMSVFVNATIPLTTIPLIAFGTYEYINGNENLGKISLYGGLGLLVGLECVYQGGKFIFKVW